MDVTQTIRQRVVRDIFLNGWNRQEFDEVAPHLPGPVDFNFRGDRFTTSLDELKRLVAMWRAAFPDLHFKIQGIAGEGDLVAINLIFTGTHRGPWKDLDPTGRRIEVEEMMFFRFDGDRLVEIWEVFDEHRMRQQLAAGPAEG